MAGRTTYEGPAVAFAAYESVVATNPLVDRKGAKMPYTSRNGHMFSFLDASGSMALRLPAKARTEFVATYGTALAVQHGATMMEYVVVPDALLANTDELRTWFDQSHDYVGTLAPKATKRRGQSRG